MMKIFLFLLVPIILVAQENGSGSIKVDATTDIAVVADVIYFSVSFGMEKDDPQEAFDAHKKMEERFLKLIKKFNVPDSSIQYSLMSIKKVTRRKDKKNYFKTSQRVKISFNNIKQYYPVQIELLKNGFYSYRSGFSSTHLKDAQKKGYVSALKLAHDNAELIAQSLKRKLGPLLHISADVREFRQLDHGTSIRIPSVRSLVEIEQTIQFRTTLKVEYQLN